MLIRSQNRKDLIEGTDFSVVRANHRTGGNELGYVIELYKHGVHCVMGWYSTQEKAMKVLDMLEHEYTEIICDFRHGYKPVQLPKVFQMPADEEVEEE